MRSPGCHARCGPSVDAQSLSQVKEAFVDGGGTILVAMDEETSPSRVRTLLTAAANTACSDLNRPTNGQCGAVLRLLSTGRTV